jgi:hypothetical protein
MTREELEKDDTLRRDIETSIRKLKTQENAYSVLVHALTVWYDVFTVRALGEMIVAEQKESNLNRDDLETYIHESIDGTQEVIYTFQAQLVAAASENTDEAQDDGIEYGPKNGMFDSQRAFYALRADVLEWLRRNGLDINNLPDDEE